MRGVKLHVELNREGFAAAYLQDQHGNFFNQEGRLFIRRLNVGSTKLWPGIPERIDHRDFNLWIITSDKEIPTFPDSTPLRELPSPSKGDKWGPIYLLFRNANPTDTPTGTSTSTPTLTPSPSVTPTPTLPPTPTVTATSTPHIIDTMDSLSGWKTSFCDDLCVGANGSSSIDVSLVSGRTNNAIEISYDVKKYGWVVIEKDIKPSILSEITGISFYYRGGDVSNTPNTIELKLMLRYIGDVDETVFGVLWYGATNAGTGWKLIEVPFGDFTCWWPDANCDKHEELDLTNVLRLSFAISNKPEYRDEDGIGEIAFDDVLGLQP